jgi:hypothetical protein
MLLFGGARVLGQASPAKLADGDLQGEFTKAVKAFMEEYRAADANAREKLLADPAREPRHRFTPLFLAAAERHKGSPAAIPYWAWLIENGTIVDPQVGEQAVTRLLADHVADPGLAPGARALGRAAGVRGPERTIADLTRIIQGSPHAPVRAEALLQRGLLRREGGSPEASKDLERAAAEAPDSPPGKRAAETLAAARPLAIGDQAPDFEGRTLAESTIAFVVRPSRSSESPATPTSRGFVNSWPPTTWTGPPSSTARPTAPLPKPGAWRRGRRPS